LGLNGPSHKGFDRATLLTELLGHFNELHTIDSVIFWDLTKLGANVFDTSIYIQQKNTLQDMRRAYSLLKNKKENWKNGTENPAYQALSNEVLKKKEELVAFKTVRKNLRESLTTAQIKLAKFCFLLKGKTALRSSIIHVLQERKAQVALGLLTKKFATATTALANKTAQLASFQEECHRLQGLVDTGTSQHSAAENAVTETDQQLQEDLVTWQREVNQLRSQAGVSAVEARQMNERCTALQNAATASSESKLLAEERAQVLEEKLNALLVEKRTADEKAAEEKAEAQEFQRVLDQNQTQIDNLTRRSKRTTKPTAKAIATTGNNKRKAKTQLTK
jgi:DNA repair exonuclease SbcCD ATPase subunit